MGVLILAAAAPQLAHGRKAAGGNAAATARARALFEQAEAHFGRSEFDAALKLYEQAYAARPLPGFHFNMAQCHRSMKRYDKAILHFGKFLELARDDRHRARAEQLLRECREAQQRQRAAAADADTAPTDTAAAADADTGAADADTGAADANTGAAAPDAAEISNMVGFTPPRKRHGAHPVYFWSFVGLTGALVVTGTISGAMALSKSSTYRDPATPPEDRPGLKDSGESLKKVANFSFAIAAGTALASGLIALVTDFGAGEVTVGAGPAAGGAMMALSGSF